MFCPYCKERLIFHLSNREVVAIQCLRDHEFKKGSEIFDTLEKSYWLLEKQKIRELELRTRFSFDLKEIPENKELQENFDGELKVIENENLIMITVRTHDKESEHDPGSTDDQET